MVWWSRWEEAGRCRCPFQPFYCRTFYIFIVDDLSKTPGLGGWSPPPSRSHLMYITYVCGTYECAMHATVQYSTATPDINIPFGSKNAEYIMQAIFSVEGILLIIISSFHYHFPTSWMLVVRYTSRWHGQL